MKTAFGGLLRTYNFSLDNIHNRDLVSTVSLRKQLLLNQIVVPCKFYMIVKISCTKGDREILICIRHKIKVVYSEVKKSLCLMML